MLGGLLLVQQAAVLHCQFLDLCPPFDDCGVASEVDIGGCDVTEALVVAVIVVMVDEGVDLGLEIAGQVIVL